MMNSAQPATAFVAKGQHGMMMPMFVMCRMCMQ